MDNQWSDAYPLKPEKNLPLSYQLRDIIRTKITTGILTPGEMLPTEIELAEAYQVSRTTVRQALNPLVQEGLLLSTRGRGTCVQQKRAHTGNTVGLVCPFLRWYALDLIEGIQKAIQPYDYELIIRNSNHNNSIEAEQIADVMRSGIKGLILWPATAISAASSQPIDKILAGELPTVVVDLYTDKLDTVTTHNFGGGYLLGQHLLALGYRRIAFIGGLQLPTEKERLSGLREAMWHHAVPMPFELVFQDWSNETLFCHWLHQTKPEAICCANDGMAIELLKRLAGMGIKVPDEVAVTGYDNNLPLVTAAHPPLTSVNQDFLAMGQTAGRLLLERLGVVKRAFGSASPLDTEQQLGAVKSGLQHVVLPAQLYVRESSAGHR